MRLVLALVILFVPAWAQVPPSTDAVLSGRVQDISGAVMQFADVLVYEASGDEPVAAGVTDDSGNFRFDLPIGTYRVDVVAPAFQTYSREHELRIGMDPLEITLNLEAITTQEVDVNATLDELIADTSMSLMSTTLSGDELLGLPDSEDELAMYLMLLAGVDTTGDFEEDIVSNFIIDGFDDGRLPSLDQISQIIIDPNTLSADGGGPRIEIVTRPGTDRWRRSVEFGFADESLNALTPGERRKEPRQTRDLGLEASGPVIPGFLELELDFSTRVDENAANSLRAITPTGDLFQGVVRPEREKEFGIEGEMAISDTHTLSVGYQYETSRGENSGVGGFTLPERGSDDQGSQWSVDVRNRMFGDNHTNDLRFRIGSDHEQEVPITEGYAYDVADAFRGGGGTNRSIEESLTYQVENRLRWERELWRLEWGAEVEYTRDKEISEDNYNGTFDFASLHDYCYATSFGGVNCQPTRQIVEATLVAGQVPVYTDARGQAIEITGVPETFTQTSGDTLTELHDIEFQTHFQADRGFGENASLRLGVSYDVTNRSIDYARINPTVNFQYRFTEDTLVSVGGRLSFSDFRSYNTLARPQRYLEISFPSFPNPFEGGNVTEVTEETESDYVLDDDYQSPYSFSPQVNLNQDLPGGIRLRLSYNWNLGVHQQRTRNINAPYPGTPLPDEILDLPRDERQDVIDRMRPLYPVVGNIYQIESTGRSVSHGFRVGLQPRRDLEFLGMRLSGQIDYRYNTGHDDNDFNNPYVREWGPTNRRHQVQSQFRIRMPEEIGFDNPFFASLARATYAGTNFNFNFRANTGNLYSIRSGVDLNGDQSTRDRPPGVGRNTETGPGSWGLNMTFTKEFYFGSPANETGGETRPRRGRGPREGEARMRFQARVNNLLNHSQPRAYSGVLTSPFFGQPTGYSGGRTVSLSMNLDF